MDMYLSTRWKGPPIGGLFLWGGLLLVGGGAQAQRPVAPGSRAQVYRVPATGEAARFEVPQVRLPSAAVAQRINKQLLQFAIADEFGEVDSTASPQRQLRQAARACCYDKDSNAWITGFGHSAARYQVLVNQQYLLSVEFQYDYRGLDEPATHHLTFDLHTGRVLTLDDLVADSYAQLSRRLAAAVVRRLRDELANVVANYGDSATIARVAQLYGIETWDTTPQRGRALGAVGIGLQSPLEFALRPDALLLFCPLGMSRYDFEFLPEERYIFPFNRLHPRRLLLPLLKREVNKKK